MSSPTDDRLLAFLEGRLDEEERLALLDALDADPTLARRVRAAAAGLEAVASGDARAPAPSRRPGVPRWWIPAAVAATLLVAVPFTALLSIGRESPTEVGVAQGMPSDPEPSYVVVLHGIWPDADDVSADEAERRAGEYWGWTDELADDGILVAAGDLRWEPGERIDPPGERRPVPENVVQEPDYVVGMFTVRAGSYDEAVEIARGCPHLRYGGSVSVRRVGGGFVTVPHMGDWTE